MVLPLILAAAGIAASAYGNRKGAKAMSRQAEFEALRQKAIQDLWERDLAETTATLTPEALAQESGAETATHARGMVSEPAAWASALRQRGAMRSVLPRGISAARASGMATAVDRGGARLRSALARRLQLTAKARRSLDQSQTDVQAAAQQGAEWRNLGGILQMAGGGLGSMQAWGGGDGQAQAPGLGDFKNVGTEGRLYDVKWTRGRNAGRA